MHWLKCDIRHTDERRLTACYQAMTPARRQEADRFTSPQARLLTLAGEMLAKQAAAELLNTREEQLILVKDAKGSPYLTHRQTGERVNTHISIAHSGHFAVAAASLQPIGIDIEMLKSPHPSLYKRLCTPRELSGFHASDDPNLCLLKLWTAKEAYFKKLGTGITDLKSIDTAHLDKEYFLFPDHIICIVK